MHKRKVIALVFCVLLTGNASALASGLSKPTERFLGTKQLLIRPNIKDEESKPLAKRADWSWINLGEDEDGDYHFVKLGIADRDGDVPFEWRINQSRRTERGWFSCSSSEVSFAGDRYWSLIPEGSMLAEGFREACY